MIERIKLWYYNHKTWIYNTQYILYSIVLLILVILVDLNYYDIKNYIPDFFFTRVAMAKTILATLAGAQLTITTFTFSVILSMMASYISNFSPRVIENFVGEKITMKVLGIFFGGFFYSITSLLFMRDFSEDTRVIAGFVAVIYAITSMIYFIIFVQKVLYSAKIENLINNIYDKTLLVIENELKKRENYKAIFSEDNTKSLNLYPNTNGFLSVINYAKISTLLKGDNCELIVDCKIGDYVNVEKPLAHINKAKTSEFDNELMSTIADNFFLTDNKIYENDYRHGLDKIEEVAVRSMAPGVKYPNTAIHCVHKITLLLTHLSKTDNYHIVVEGNENTKISYTAYTFEEDLSYSLGGIIHYGKDDVDLMYAVLEGLETLYYSSTAKNKYIVFNYVKDTYENIIPEPRGEFNKKRLEYIYERIKAKHRSMFTENLTNKSY